jgi:hypothetical protein
LKLKIATLPSIFFSLVQMGCQVSELFSVQVLMMKTSMEESIHGSLILTNVSTLEFLNL